MNAKSMSIQLTKNPKKLQNAFRLVISDLLNCASKAHSLVVRLNNTSIGVINLLLCFHCYVKILYYKFKNQYFLRVDGSILPYEGVIRPCLVRQECQRTPKYTQLLLDSISWRSWLV